MGAVGSELVDDLVVAGVLGAGLTQLSIDELLKAADEAMYYTKGHGRKGYTLAEDGGEKK